MCVLCARLCFAVSDFKSLTKPFQQEQCPDPDSLKDLVDAFGDFFVTKIQKIRTKLDSQDPEPTTIPMVLMKEDMFLLSDEWVTCHLSLNLLKASVNQLSDDMNKMRPLPSGQSAYKPFHNTALLKVQFDILLNMDDQKVMLLTLAHHLTQLTTVSYWKPYLSILCWWNSFEMDHVISFSRNSASTNQRNS